MNETKLCRRLQVYDTLSHVSGCVVYPLLEVRHSLLVRVCEVADVRQVGRPRLQQLLLQLLVDLSQGAL